MSTILLLFELFRKLLIHTTFLVYKDDFGVDVIIIIILKPAIHIVNSLTFSYKCLLTVDAFAFVVCKNGARESMKNSERAEGNEECVCV